VVRGVWALALVGGRWRGRVAVSVPCSGVGEWQKRSWKRSGFRFTKAKFKSLSVVKIVRPIRIVQLRFFYNRLRELLDLRQ
jgi:hypothetical protein